MKMLTKVADDAAQRVSHSSGPDSNCAGADSQTTRQGSQLSFRQSSSREGCPVSRPHADDDYALPARVNVYAKLHRDQRIHSHAKWGRCYPTVSLFHGSEEVVKCNAQAGHAADRVQWDTLCLPQTPGEQQGRSLPKELQHRVMCSAGHISPCSRPQEGQICGLASWYSSAGQWY